MIVDNSFHRVCRVINTAAFPQIVVAGKSTIDCCSNNYLGLAQDDRLKQAAIAATLATGTGAGASRLISGTSPAVQHLEETVAAWKQSESALVFNSGYQMNVGLFQALFAAQTAETVVFADKLIHASLLDGIQLSGVKLIRYRHQDLEHLTEKLRHTTAFSNRWLVSESVFSMDGDCTDLKALTALCKEYGVNIILDEAHASGLYGQTNSGLAEQQGVCDDIAIHMGTFSKALGSVGGYVASSKAVINQLVNCCRSFIYTTALPPGVIAACQTAVEVVQQDNILTQHLWNNVALLRTLLTEAGYPATADSPIFPLVVGSSEAALAKSEALLDAGFFVSAIRPPTVPEGSARLRITVSASHTPEQLTALVTALNNA